MRGIKLGWNKKKFYCFVFIGLLDQSLINDLLLQVMENLQNLTNLQELWLGRNRIKAINLCGLKFIKKISLQSNRLTSMKGFEVFHFGYCVTVYISDSEGIELHKRVHWACCFFDCLCKDCVSLEELYLSHNGIAKMEGLSPLANLRVLDVSSNKLTSVNDIQNLKQYVYYSLPIPLVILFCLWLLISPLEWICLQVRRSMA